jgi:AAA domain
MLTRPSSDTTPKTTSRLIVAEGMPGAGKTTALQVLAGQGHTVVGEYTTPAGHTVPMADHPSVDDDDSHQRNWLIKSAQARDARGARKPVWLDRDWLTSLAYAASLADRALLAERAGWAADHLAAGDLQVADSYVVLHVDHATSLARRADRLSADHVWSSRPGLVRLGQFYADPVAAVATVHAELAGRLAAVSWRHLHGPTIAEAVRVLEHEGAA